MPVHDLYRNAHRYGRCGKLISKLITMVPLVALYGMAAPAQPATGTDLDHVILGSFNHGRAQEYNGSDLLLVSWNIERGLQQAGILQAFHGPLCGDLYLLQEVDAFAQRTGFRDIARDFARSLSLNYAFGVEFEELSQGRPGQAAFHGQAILSRFPILKARVLRFRHQLYGWNPRWRRWLPRWAWLQPRRGGRMALIVEIALGQRTLVVYNVHLESQARDKGRAKQIQEILRDIEQNYEPGAPVIVAGDLNTREGAGSPVVGALRAAGLRDVLQGHPGEVRTKAGDNRRVDWIFMRNLSFSDGQVAAVNLSDHYPLTVRFAPPGAADRSSAPCHPQPPRRQAPAAAGRSPRGGG